MNTCAFHRFLAALAILSCMMAVLKDCAYAQVGSTKKPFMLVTWYGSGVIQLPQGPDWKPEMLTVYDDGRRPVAQFSNAPNNLTVSFILFENKSGTPTARGCREDAVSAIVKNDGKLISKRVDDDATLANGIQVATTSFLFDMNLAGAGHQQNLFAFAGDAKTCAEVHISSVVDKQGQQERMKDVLAEFHPDLLYRPSAIDYFHVAQVLFKNAPELAAPYYRASLDATPADAGYITTRRIATDQLVMSLGRSGDLKGSRAVAESAIAVDPDYPINYYNLACADAERGDPVGAEKYLQAAFDRRKNVLQGESMPDPTQDDSIIKLKHDKTFWQFVLSLPKN